MQTDGDGDVDTEDRGGYSAAIFSSSCPFGSRIVFGSEVDEFGRGALTLRFSRPVSACHRLPRRGLSVAAGQVLCFLRFWHYSAA